MEYSLLKIVINKYFEYDYLEKGWEKIQHIDFVMKLRKSFLLHI